MEEESWEESFSSTESSTDEEEVKRPRKKQKAFCKLCNKTFSTNQNLRKHIKNVHNKPIKAKTGKFYCDICSGSFTRESNLRRHKQNVHSTKDTNKYKYYCDVCTEQFLNWSSYYQHQNEYNHGKLISGKIYRCPICSLDGDKKNLVKHYIEDHNIILKESHYHFKSMEEFYKWRKSYELETRTKYVRCYKAKNKSRTFHYLGFLCSHPGTGIFKPGDIDKSHTEKYLCPAGIKIKKNRLSGPYEVTITETHVGHTVEPAIITKFVMLENIVEKNVVFDQTTDELKLSLDDSKNPILNEDDLCRVKLAFSLCTNLEESDNLLAVDSWIKDLQEKTDNSVLLYKAEGSLFQGFDELKEDDFVLIIMTTCQAKILQKYCSNSICLDWYRAKDSQIYLVTLLVTDDTGEVYPCGFLVANQINKDIIKVFLQHVKFKIGMVIQSNVLMTDMDDCFSGAWIEVMGKPYLIWTCPWYVDHAWREDLKERDEIPHEKKVEVYRLLRNLLDQKDTKVFKDQLSKMHKYFAKNETLQKFAIHFKTNFMMDPMSWSLSNSNLPINIKIAVENMHRILKYTHWMGQKVNRFDRTIGAIMRVMRDKTINRLISFDREELLNIIEEIRVQHERSLEIELGFVIKTENGGWGVLSNDQTKIYEVQKVKLHCKCELRCEECNSCFHQYVCSCVHSSVSYKMCKHIHAFCRHPKSANAQIANQSSKNIELHFVDDAGNISLRQKFDNLVEDIFHTGDNLEKEISRQEREELVADFQTMVDTANSEEFLFIKKFVGVLKMEMDGGQKQRK